MKASAFQRVYTSIENITKAIDQLVKENNIPGINLSIIFKDGKQENYSSGYAGIRYESP